MIIIEHFSCPITLRSDTTWNDQDSAKTRQKTYNQQQQKQPTKRK